MNTTRNSGSVWTESMSSRPSDLTNPLLETSSDQRQPSISKTFYAAFLCFSILSASTVGCMNSFTVTINNFYGKDFSVEEPNEYFSYYSGWGIFLLIFPLSAFLANIASGSVFTRDAVKASIHAFNTAIGSASNTIELTDRIKEPPMSRTLAISALIGGTCTAFTYAALSIDAFKYLLTLTENRALHVPLFILYVLLISGSTFVSTSSRIASTTWLLTRAPLGISYLYPDKVLELITPEDWLMDIKQEAQIYGSIRLLLQRLRDIKDLIPYLNQEDQRTLVEHLEYHQYEQVIAWFKEKKPKKSETWNLFLTYVNRPILSILALLAGPLFYTIGYQLKNLIGHPALSEAIAILSTPLHVLMFMVTLPRSIRSMPTFYQYIKNMLADHSTVYARIIISCIILVSACSYGGLAYSAHNHAKAGDLNSFFPFLSQSILISAFTVTGGASASIINLFCIMTFCLERLSGNTAKQDGIITKKQIDSLMKEIENLGLHAVNKTNDYQHNCLAINMSSLFSAFTAEEENIGPYTQTQRYIEC